MAIAAYLGGQEAFIYALLTIIFLSCLVTTAFIPEEAGGRATVPRKSRPQWLLPRPQSAWLTLSQCVSAFMSVGPAVYAACVQVPAVMWRLFIANLCNWMALMSVIFFFADFMGEGLYQGVPSAELQSEERKQFDEGKCCCRSVLSTSLQRMVVTRVHVHLQVCAWAACLSSCSSWCRCCAPC